MREFARHAPLVRLIAEPERAGKASAVNTFMREATADVLVLQSADTVPELGAIEQLCRPFTGGNSVKNTRLVPARRIRGAGSGIIWTASRS